jgi:peptidyl-prolyl cis-trans isomerase SurA
MNIIAFSRKKILLGTLCLFFFYACTTTQNTSKKKKDPVIFTIDNQPIYLPEFKYVYEKSITDKDSLYVQKSVEDYLDLYINFKLKITEAQKMGTDTSDAFQQELESYKEISAKPYLVEKSKVDALVKEAYQRLQKEIKASHILIKLHEEADPQDTLEAYQKIKEIREKAVVGEDFGQLALTHSDDPSAKDNKGNLGYFTALQMVYPFECAAYQTDKGQVSPIVRTRFGYHILKIHEQRPATGQITVAHIMIQTANKSGSQEENTETKRKIDEIYQKLQSGENWDKLCSQYSDDATSKNQGGKLPPFKAGEVLPSFEEVAFGLQNVNDYSAPFQTPYGWHLVKLIAKQGLESFEKLEPKLKEEVTKDSRYQESQKALIQRIKIENAFKDYPQVLKEALTKADKRLMQGSWSYNSTDVVVAKTLFNFKNKGLKTQQSYTVKDFFDYVYQKQVPKPTITDSLYCLKSYYEKFTDDVAIHFAKQNLVKTNQSYAMLINEYREGMMYFQLMSDKVWDRGIQDTSGCKKYFLAHRDNYQWGERASVAIYQLANQSAFETLKPYLLKDLYPVNALKIDNLYFDKDESALNQDALNSLNQLAALLQKDPTLKVIIKGHADPSEKATTAENRIKPAGDYLIFKKIDASRIITQNFGNTQPVSKTDRNKNRRVEFSFLSSSKKELEKLINESNPLNLKITEGDFQKGENEFLDKVTWKPGTYTLEQNGQVVYVEIKDIKQPRLKDYDEARGYVITDYQKYLEQNWMKDLKQKYQVQINQDVLNKLYK